MTERSREAQPLTDGGSDLAEEVQQLRERIDELGGRVDELEQTQMSILNRLDGEPGSADQPREQVVMEEAVAPETVEEVEQKVDEMQHTLNQFFQSYNEFREFQESELEDQLAMWTERMDDVSERFEDLFYEFKRETERPEEFEDLLREIRFTVDRVEDELEAQREPEGATAEFRTKLQKANRVSVPSVEVETLGVEPGDVLEVRIRPVDGTEAETEQEADE